MSDENIIVNSVQEARSILREYLECEGAKTRGILYLDWENGLFSSDAIWSPCGCYDDVVVPGMGFVAKAILNRFGRKVLLDMCIPAMFPISDAVSAPLIKKRLESTVKLMEIGGQKTVLRNWPDGKTMGLLERVSYLDSRANQLLATLRSKSKEIDDWINLKLGAEKALREATSKSNRVKQFMEEVLGGRAIGPGTTIDGIPVDEKYWGQFRIDVPTDNVLFPDKRFYCKKPDGFNPAELPSATYQWRRLIDDMYDGNTDLVPDGPFWGQIKSLIPDIKTGESFGDINQQLSQAMLEKELVDATIEGLEGEAKAINELVESALSEKNIHEQSIASINDEIVKEQINLSRTNNYIDAIYNAKNQDRAILARVIEEVGDVFSEIGALTIELLIGILGFLTIKEDKECTNGVVMDETTCMCSICQEGKQLCDVTSIFDRNFDWIPKLPATRTRDELNFCLDACCGDGQQIARPFTGSTFSPNLSEFLNWLEVVSPCYCGCETETTQNEWGYVVNEGPPREWKECPDSSADDLCPPEEKTCTTKFPPDNAYGNFAGTSFEWDPVACDWSCKDQMWNGVAISGSPFPSGEECGYDVDCFHCGTNGECLSEKVKLTGRQIRNGANCSGLEGFGKKYFDSCDDINCPSSSSSSSSSPECEVLTFAGIPYSGQLINGTCRYTVQCYQCENTFSSNYDFENADCESVEATLTKQQILQGPNCTDWNGSEKGRIIKRWNSCAEADCRESSSSSSCVPIVFGGVEYQGFVLNGKCTYNVTCFRCENDECLPVDANISSTDALSWPNCPDWNRPGLELFNSCDQSNCFSSSSSSSSSPECEPVNFGGVQYHGVKIDGVCRYTVRCYQCENTFSSVNDFEIADCNVVDAALTKQQIQERPNCTDWNTTEKGREIKRWNSCADADCRESSSSSSCGTITFAGVEYQGFSMNGECMYTVNCFTCSNKECVTVDADITASQASQYPNCSDWSRGSTTLYNTCEEASLAEQCCPEGYEFRDGECLTKLFYCKND